MNLKKRFLQQQILTTTGIVSLILSIVYSLYYEEYYLLLISFFYSQIVVSLIATQIILHRYFSHKSFKIHKYTQLIFYALSFLPGQGSPISWAAAHRHHHKHSDTELDNHSPLESYFLAAGGWLLKGYNWVINVKKLKTIPTDLLRDATLIKIDRYYYLIWFLILLISGIIFPVETLFFISAPIGWNLLISAFVTLGCHIKLPGSYKSFETSDNTHNNMIIQLMVLGDGLHNNHHRYPNNYFLKNNWYEFDLAGTIISLIKLPRSEEI